MTWIKTNVEFGVPWCTFTIGAREALSCRIEAVMGNRKGDDVKQLEHDLMDLIAVQRPALKYCVIIAIELAHFEWRITVIHPSLPRVQSHVKSEKRLMTCPICKGDFGEMRFCKKPPKSDMLGVSHIEVCSEACAEPDGKIAGVAGELNQVVADPVLEFFKGKHDG